MISGQVDRLRTAAQTYRRLGNHSAESMLLDAADTIWKLRDDLQRTNADNAKLRELANRMLGSIRRFEACSDSYSVSSVYEQWMRELGVVE